MKTRYRNVAFLVELVINILVFSISCAVLVGLFGKAGKLSKATLEETRAGTEVNALVETLKAGGAVGGPVAVQAMNSVNENTTDVYYCYYDKDWKAVNSEQESRYVIELEVKKEKTGAGTLQNISARASAQGNNELYKLKTTHYIPAW